MKKIAVALRELKEENRGAACFFDPDTKKHKCFNDLTEQEAKKAASSTGVKLKKWSAGKKCSEVSCG